MRLKLRSLLFGVVASSLVPFSPIAAQEQVIVNGIEATRIVIGPATTPLAKIIKSGLRDAFYEEAAGSESWQNAQGLYYFYGARNFEPLWLQGEGDDVQFSDKAEAIIELFKQAELEGLRTSDYLTDAIDLEAARGNPQKLAKVETALSDAAILYAKHAAGGRINPRSVSSNITLSPTRLDLNQLRVDLVNAEDPAALLQSFHPTHTEFKALRQALIEKINGPEIDQIIVPDGKLIKSGYKDDRMPILRERLNVPLAEGDDPFEFNQAMVDAVKEFQASIGLIADGVVGPATVAALNGAQGASVEDIVANMERWRWMPKDLGDFHVFVNIPEFRLQVRKGDEVQHATRVVVGKPKHATPVFSDTIEHVVVNPYWNVPYSIATKELLPSANGNPGYFTSRNYELLSGGKVINASSVDWANINPKNPPFRIRQRPGAGNALGKIKFLFPNQHSVYLHDTPSKSLFGRTYRAFSHGCVRVHNPFEFADALLRYEPDLNIGKIKGMLGSTEKWNNLKRKVPVHLAYFTLRIDQDGTVRSFGDVYGHHQRLLDLLAR
jgi:murein L,D-transpeptidase YcbB/YkuD